jgi:hypothetical protein
LSTNWMSRMGGRYSVIELLGARGGQQRRTCEYVQLDQGDARHMAGVSLGADVANG